jgi:hypothetical protein
MTGRRPTAGRPVSGLEVEMKRFGRWTVPLTGVGIVALVAVAAFLILDLSSRSVDPSSLPVIQLGQTGTSQAGQNTPGSGTAGQGLGPGQTTGDPGTPATAAPEPGITQTTSPGSSSTTTTTSGGSTTTGSTVRETINGGVHTGTTGGTSSSGTTGTSTGSTGSTGGR